MKTIKKITVLVVILVLVSMSFMPSTFSWYTHNNNAEEGTKINYTNTDLPVSIKSAATVNNSPSLRADTYVSNANGEVADYNTTVSAISLNFDSSSAHKAVKYYKTVFTNAGSNDVYLDFNGSTLKNNADFYIGTFSPTLNEKAYASRPVRTKSSAETIRVYFKTCDHFYDGSTNIANNFWNEDNGSFTPESSSHPAGNNSTTNDINMAYTVDGTETQVKMTKCANSDTVTSDNTTSNVYYADIPSNTSSIYFFNHWYLKSGSNRDWNRTNDITDIAGGKLYYLTGKIIDGKTKEHASREVDTELVAVNKYYSYLRMSMGDNVYANISLSNDSEDEETLPDFYGQTLSYASVYFDSNNNNRETTDTAYATVSLDGDVRPRAYTDSLSSANKRYIKTTITGKFGDSMSVYTEVDIPQNIGQVPIVSNLKVPAEDSVELDWYVINKSSEDNMTSAALFYTI